MYKRDVAVLLVACFALFFSLQHESRISIRKAWYHLYADDDPDLFSARTKLPAPVVADLNGDGDLEVVIATHDYKLEVIRPKGAGRAGDGFAKAHSIATVSLLPSKVAVAGSRRPAALAVGYLDPPATELVRKPRKQVVVVVTAGWHVMCFDHNLKLLWEHSAVDHLPHHAQLEEVAVHVTHHQVQKGDRGLVIVGGALMLGDILHPDTQEDLLREQVEHELNEDDDDETSGGTGSRRKLQAATNSHVTTELDGADTSRHFSYFAYEGATGQSRWTHDAKFLHSAELEDLADEMHPQENYKLEAESLEGRHYQEASCRDYAGSVLHIMPHAWTTMLDTRLEEAHFVKHHEAKGAQKKALGKDRRATLHGHRPPAKLAGIVDNAPFSSLIKPKGHHHSPDPKGKHGKQVQGANVTHANSLVAHLKEGIEVIHLYSGRTICQLHLPDNMLHVDMDGDGVMDHVQVSAGSDDLVFGGATSSSAHHHGGHCVATVHSGIPPRHHLWSARVCNLEAENILERVSESTQFRGPHHEVQILPPVFLPLPKLDGGYGPRGRQHGILVFLSSKGEVTALDQGGEVLWSDSFGVGWDPIPGGMGPSPTLLAVPLRPHAIPSAVLVAGAFTAVLLTEQGHQVDRFSLPAPPTHPLTIADFNGDGLNDFMLVTPRGVFGYQQVHHLGGYSFSALVLTLIIAMAIVYFMQQVEGAGVRGGKKARSTEFTD